MRGRDNMIIGDIFNSANTTGVITQIKPHVGGNSDHGFV